MNESLINEPRCTEITGYSDKHLENILESSSESDAY